MRKCIKDILKTFNRWRGKERQCHWRLDPLFTFPDQDISILLARQQNSKSETYQIKGLHIIKEVGVI